MRTAQVFYNRVPAGILKEENPHSYQFTYYDNYLKDQNLPAISLTMPKSVAEYHSTFLFPFFYNMIAEGVNRTLQSRELKIDENDAFGFLLATAKYDTIGAITVKPIDLA